MTTNALSAPKTSRRHERRAEIVLYAAAVLGTYSVVALAMRLWKADLRIPFDYGGDANFHGMLLKAVSTHGWYETNPNLGAPFGQHLQDFPVADNLHLVITKVLSVFTHDYGVLLNVYFLLTFGLTALTSVWVFRRLGASRPVTLVVAILYAVLPYHFFRGEGHLFLAAYYSVPLSIYLIVTALRGQPLLPAAPETPWRRRLLSWPAAGLLGMVLIIGSASSYYAAFTLVLLVAAGALAIVRHRRLPAARTALVVILLVGGVQFANLMPDLLYRQAHGLDAAVAHRDPNETEVYSLKLAHMVLPMEQHRIGALARLRFKYASTFPVPSEGRAAALGVVAAFGLLWLLAVPLLALVGNGARGPTTKQRELSALAVFAFLVATTGGLATLTSFFLTAQIRAWNRMSIFLGFLALASVALLLDALARRLLAYRRGPQLLGGVLLVVLAVGVFDQTSNAFIPNYPALRQQFESDGAFVGDIERLLPHDAMVFQLPYVPFPEAGSLIKMVDYDHLRGYLHSTSLRWSYGGVKGRPGADWQQSLMQLPAPTLVPALAASGFDGIYLDRFGYADNGAAAEAGIAQVLGQPPMVSHDDRLVFFSLVTYRRQLLARVGNTALDAVRDRTLFPTRVEYGPGFSGAHVAPPDTWRWTNGDATMAVIDPGAQGRTVSLRFALAAPTAEPWSATLALPDGSKRTYSVTSARMPLELQLTLHPGQNLLHLTAQPPGGFSASQSNQGNELQVFDVSFAEIDLPSLVGVHS